MPPATLCTVVAVAEQRQLLIAYEEKGVAGAGETPVLLLHGSPGSRADFGALLQAAELSRRWIAVDLPGFGDSERDIADYSFAAQAHALELLLKELALARVHVVGFSMGGGVALSLYERNPALVASLTLLSSIGVQELELLGDYRLNHVLHGVQLAAIWAMLELVPHFGLFDDSALDIPFARNFFDSDQRPLRALLARFEAPALIFHGERDPLVPFAAALEHHRLLPQSELHAFGEGHFLLWQRPAELAGILADFVSRAERGAAPTRPQAEPERVHRAALDFASLPQPAATGVALFTLMALLFACCFLAEDLTCLAAGVLVATGRLEFQSALGACAGGIFVGDMLLYFVGRRFGERVLSLRGLRVLLNAERLHRAERWFAQRGLIVILLTRLIPGARLPTYVAAGVLRTPFLRFAAYFLCAVALWVPLVIGFGAAVGQHALLRLRELQHAGLLVLALALIAAVIIVRLAIPLSNHSGRRRLLGAWRRWRRWEFWPTWLVYLLLSPHFFRLAFRWHGLRGVTAVNPGIESGGLVGESKSAILTALGGQHPMIARWTLLSGQLDAARRFASLQEWRAREGIGLPIVLKPDVGERGRGVRIVRDETALQNLLLDCEGDWIAQEHIGGEEFGVFYLRDPRSDEARIFSINAKRMPVLEGDGCRTLRQLILDDERAVILADVYLAQNEARLDSIPAAGEKVQLVELGTHCRGAMFLDARHHATEALLTSLDALARNFPGFCFGRFDLRVPDVAALEAGRDLRILELNGLSSEATHIYDPAISWREGLATLREQWSLAFAFAAEQRRRGHPATPWRPLLARVSRALRA